jgi:uncharacterized protein
MMNNSLPPNESPEPLKDILPAESAVSRAPAPAPPPRRWGAWPAIGFGAVILLVFVVVQNIVALVFLVIDLVKAYSVNPNLDLMEYLRVLTTNLMTNGQLISIAEIFAAAACLGMIYLFIKIRHGFSFREYLCLKPIGVRTILILVAALIGIVGISELVGRFVPPPNDTFTVEIYKTAGWLPLLWFAVAVCAPLWEETFFRGFLFVSLKDTFIGPYGTIFVTALVFAGLHALQYDLYGVIVVFSLGVIFGLVRLATGSLWSTILLHAIWNAAELILAALTIK